jgi:GTP-binding protein
LRENFPSLRNAPIAFITAKTGKNVKKLLNHCQLLYKQSLTRVATPELNKLLQKAISNHAPPVINQRRAKVYFATQISVQPPTIVLKCNHPDYFPKTYQRYLLSVLQDNLSFGEVPIRLILEQRGSSDQKDELQPVSA